MTSKDNYCVIMGGGIGSRFWPFSRKTMPKQFLDFFGTGRSLLQQTFDRFNKIIHGEHTYRNQCDIRRLGKRTTSGIRSKTNLAGTGKKKYGSVHCMGIISYTCFKSKCQHRSCPFRSSDLKRGRIFSRYRERTGLCIKI